MLKEINNSTANQAYKKYRECFRVSADGSEPLSFKQWLIENKDQNGNLKIDGFVGANSDVDQTQSTTGLPNEIIVKVEKPPFRFLGMRPIVAIPVIAAASFAIYKLYQYSKKS